MMCITDNYLHLTDKINGNKFRLRLTNVYVSAHNRESLATVTSLNIKETRATVFNIESIIIYDSKITINVISSTTYKSAAKVKNI